MESITASIKAVKTDNFLIRPIRENDAQALIELVGQIGDGLTSLPKDKDFLITRIHESLRAFYPKIAKPGGEYYLFVLENLTTRKIVGTSGILAKVGGFEPFYTYRVVPETTHFEPFQIITPNDTLQLVKSHNGPTELCSLFLHPQFREGGLGKLLSFSRFLFIKSFPKRFEQKIIAELRGFIEPDGTCPFWEAVGAKFFQKDYYTADILSGLGNKDFIEALMPKYPIYISLLPDNAKSVIGKVHPHTEPAKRLLMNQGFFETDEVDIFDAGPVLAAQRDELQIWKKANSASICIKESLQNPSKVLLSNQQLDFRGLLTEVEISSAETLSILPQNAEALNLKNGASAYYVTLS